MNFEITNKRPNNYPGFADLPEWLRVLREEEKYWLMVEGTECMWIATTIKPNTERLIKQNQCRISH
jgi:hypothetical protein